MRSWPTPQIPQIPGTGQAVHLFDTMTQSRRDVTPATETANLYVCGITPYDATHLGHAATYIAFDLLHRAWLDAGYPVNHVQNLTDVDDPLLDRAHQTGQDWRDLADQQAALFAEDMTALGVIPPTTYLSVSETIKTIETDVSALFRKGAAYSVPGVDGQPDGDVYFDISSDQHFGASYPGDDKEERFATYGGDPERQGKRHPMDPLLWRAAREGEPSWPSELLGAGRPGWHVECASIMTRNVSLPVDVKAGGADLAFPHHEMACSHLRVLNDIDEPASVHVHAGLVAYDGDKMSKSKGNLVLVSTLRADGVESMAIRLAVLSNHYRDNWEWTDVLLERGVERLTRWRDAMSREGGPASAPVVQAVRDALADDLNAPAALRAVDSWCEAQLSEDHTDNEHGAAGIVSRAVNALLGVRL